LVTNQPPASGPSAAIPPITEPQIPKAIARSRPRNVAFTIESVAGRISAAPTPCRKRPARRTVPGGASAVIRLAPRKTRRPQMNTRRRPVTSPTRPTLIRSAAKTSE
jgi:hypothetical protein